MKNRKSNDNDIKKYEGTVISGRFVPYKKTYREKVISRINKTLNVILSLLILISVLCYYFVTSSEMELNKIRKETLVLNDENMELQNHLDYLKSYSNVNARMKSSNIVQKAEQVVEVPAKELPVGNYDDTNFLIKAEKTSAEKQKNNKFKWSLGY